MLLILIGVLAILFLWFELSTKRPKGLPPGPKTLPIIGNLHYLAPTPHVALKKLAEEFGPIYSFSFGLDKAVILNDPKLIREAFNLKEFTGRASNESASFIVGDQDGILLGEGDKWSERRRFALRHLREFGFGKSTMEEYIMEEVNELIGWVKEQNGKPIELHKRFNLAVVNTFWRVLSGERYHHDDERLTKILEELEATMNYLIKLDKRSAFIFFYPSVAKLLPNWSGWNYLAGLARDRLQMFQRIVTEHKKTLLDDNPRDFLDVYLQEVKKSEDPSSAFHVSNKPDSALLSIMTDLFTAGSDTTSTTLNWAMLYLLYNQEVQEKLYNEINSVMGKSRAPSVSDRRSLPYAEATVVEILRLSSIVMSGVAHRTIEDVQFNGYLIPKGYQVFGSLYFVHHDPKIWGDPENFRPERFLSSDGKTFQKHDAFLAFSTGKRVCLGETLARDTLFLFLTSIVQNFELTFDESKPKPSLEIESGMLLSPFPYTIVMKERIF